MVIKSYRLCSPKKIAITTVALLISGYMLAVFICPLPAPVLNLTKNTQPIKLTPTDIVWPDSGGSAIGAVDYGLLQKSGSDTPLPTASIAKVVLALAVLQQKPLAIDQSGPIIELSDADVAFYNQELARNGSTVKVQSGEQLTEYQALQALLLPSGNNIASTLANWAFGSEDNYLNYSKNMLADLKLFKTNLADASGYSEQTVSTPSELVIIGIEALKNPVIKQIVGQESATIPVAGKITNVNQALGIGGINGIKTGNTNFAGGCLLFSAEKTIADQKVTLVGAIQALPNLQKALQAAPLLAESGLNNFTSVKVANKGDIFGRIDTRWNQSRSLIASETKQIVLWSGGQYQLEVAAAAGLSGELGVARIKQSIVKLQLESAISPPNYWLRVTHPFDL